MTVPEQTFDPAPCKAIRKSSSQDKATPNSAATQPLPFNCAYYPCTTILKTHATGFSETLAKKDNPTRCQHHETAERKSLHHRESLKPVTHAPKSDRTHDPNFRAI